MIIIRTNRDPEHRERFNSRLTNLIPNPDLAVVVPTDTRPIIKNDIPNIPSFNDYFPILLHYILKFLHNNLNELIV